MYGSSKSGGQGDNCCKKADVKLPSSPANVTQTNTLAAKGSKPDNSRK